MARQTASMTVDERIAFYHAQSALLRKEFGRPPLPPPKPSRAKKRPTRKAPGTTD